MRHFHDTQCELLDSRLRTIKNHIANYEDLEELLGFQSYLNVRFVTFYRQNQDTEWVKKNMAGLSAHVLFSYNILSLYSALHSIECDLIHSAAASLRTVHEAVPKMYYLSLHPEEVGEIMVHEKIHMNRYNDARKILQEEECQDYLNGEVLQFPTSNDFQEFTRKYRPSFFRKKLYDEKRKDGIDRLYEKLSNSSHANITRNKTATEYNPQNTEVFFEFLKSMSYFNIEAYVESNFALLARLNIADESRDFLNIMAKRLGDIISGVYFMPNKDDLPSKLKLKPVVK